MSVALDMAVDLRCALDPVAFVVERLNFIPDAWALILTLASFQTYSGDAQGL